MKVKSESEVAQSCPTPSDPIDCSLPGSSIHGTFQARVLEWGAMANATFFILWSNCFRFGYWGSFTWLLCPFWYPLIIMICVFIYVCVNTSVSRNTRFFRLILYVSGLCPEISHSTRSPDIFYCRMNVATKIQVSYVLAASGVFSFPGPFDWWSKEIYVCTLTCKCTCCCSVTELCLALCGPMNCSTPCFPVLHYLPEFD